MSTREAGQRNKVVCACGGIGKLKRIHATQVRYKWVCECCGGSVRCKGRSKNPYGTLASRALQTKLREARREAHLYFDKLYSEDGPISSRTKAYKWLAEVMSLTKQEAHMSMLDVDNCQVVKELSKARMQIHIDESSPNVEKDMTEENKATEEAANEIEYERPNIFVCGPSGSGKSTSFRNLDKSTTLLINTERKALPFKGARKFKKRQVSTTKEFDHWFRKALEAPGIEVVVIDSWTSVAEFAEQEIIRAGEEKSKDEGWKGYTRANDYLHGILQTSKDVNDRFVIFLGVDQETQDESGRIHSTVWVPGKKLLNKVEKEFTMVLWTKKMEPDVIQGTTDDSYVFVTNGDPANKAKSPMGMFKDRHIPNDLAEVVNAARSYYLDEDEDLDSDHEENEVEDGSDGDLPPGISEEDFSV